MGACGGKGGKGKESSDDDDAETAPENPKTEAPILVDGPTNPPTPPQPNLNKEPEPIPKKESKPAVVEEPEETADLKQIISGSESFQNTRPTMEDTLVSLDKFEASSGFVGAYYGIYDGHAGTDAAICCEQQLHKILASDLKPDTDIIQALLNAYNKMDEVIIETGEKEKWKNGTTAVSTVIHGKRLYVANLGDSEGLIGVCNTTPEGEIQYDHVLITEKHRPTVASEKKRIQAAGGTVIYGRVFGDLAVSRAFGDSDYKKPKAEGNFISAEPFAKRYDLKRNHHFMVLACDGLWDSVSYKDVVSFVAKQRTEDPSLSPAGVAKALVGEAVARKSTDNISVTVVYFEWGLETT